MGSSSSLVMPRDTSGQPGGPPARVDSTAVRTPASIADTSPGKPDQLPDSLPRDSSSGSLEEPLSLHRPPAESSNPTPLPHGWSLELVQRLKSHCASNHCDYSVAIEEVNLLALQTPAAWRDAMRSSVSLGSDHPMAIFKHASAMILCTGLDPVLEHSCGSFLLAVEKHNWLAASEILVVLGASRNLESFDTAVLDPSLRRMCHGIMGHLHGHAFGDAEKAHLRDLLRDLFRLSLQLHLWALAHHLLHDKAASLAGGDRLRPFFDAVRLELDAAEFGRDASVLMRDVQDTYTFGKGYAGSGAFRKEAWAHEFGKQYEAQEDVRSRLLDLLRLPEAMAAEASPWYKTLERVYCVEALPESTVTDHLSDVEVYTLSRMALRSKLSGPLEVLLVLICNRLSPPQTPQAGTALHHIALLPLPDLLDGTFFSQLAAQYPMLAFQVLDKVHLSYAMHTCLAELPPSMEGNETVQAFARIDRDVRRHEEIHRDAATYSAPERLYDPDFLSSMSEKRRSYFGLAARGKRLLYCFHSQRVFWRIFKGYGASSLGVQAAVVAAISPLAVVFLFCWLEVAAALSWVAVLAGALALVVLRAVGVGSATASKAVNPTARLRSVSWRLIPVRGLAQMSAHSLLGPLLASPHVSAHVFSSPVIKAFILYKWNGFYKYVMMMQFLEHIIYMALFCAFAISLGDTAGDGSLAQKGFNWSYNSTSYDYDGRQDYGGPLADYGGPLGRDTCMNGYQAGLVLCLLLVTVTHFLQEAAQVIKLRHMSMWNVVNPMHRIPSIVLMTFIFLRKIVLGCACNLFVLRSLAAIEVLLLFSRLLFYASANRQLGPFVRMVIQVAHSLFYFFVVLAVVFVGFCLTYIIIEGHADDKSANTLFGVQFTKIFGFDYQFFHDDSEQVGKHFWWAGKPAVLMVTKAIFQIVVYIVLLNLVIAIISDSHDHIRMNEEHQMYQNLAIQLVALEALLGTSKSITENLTDGKEGANMFRMVVDRLDVSKVKRLSPMDHSLDEPDDWSGRMAEMKRIQTTLVERMQGDMAELEKRVVAANEEKLRVVEEKLRGIESAQLAQKAHLAETVMLMRRLLGQHPTPPVHSDPVLLL